MIAKCEQNNEAAMALDNIGKKKVNCKKYKAGQSCSENSLPIL